MGASPSTPSGAAFAPLLVAVLLRVLVVGVLGAALSAPVIGPSLAAIGAFVGLG